MTAVADIIAAVAAYAPPQYQESWDNSGVQVGDVSAPCTGVMTCVDVTPDVVREAAAAGCNLVLAHHPLIFKGLRTLTGATQVERAVIEAVRLGVCVYSAHTSLDSTLGGISHEMAARLGARVTRVLAPSAADPAVGLGVLAELPYALRRDEFLHLCARVYGCPHPRASRSDAGTVRRVALCGGSGGEFIPRAVAAGAQAYVTADIRYHDFVDHGEEILLVDVGHYESEQCANDIFMRIVTEKFPNFAVHKSKQHNPIQYI